MFTDTHFHLHRLFESDCDCKELLSTCVKNNFPFLLDIGTDSDDLPIRVEIANKILNQFDEEIGGFDYYKPLAGEVEALLAGHGMDILALVLDHTAGLGQHTDAGLAAGGLAAARGTRNDDQCRVSNTKCFQLLSDEVEITGSI